MTYLAFGVAIAFSAYQTVAYHNNWGVIVAIICAVAVVKELYSKN